MIYIHNKCKMYYSSYRLLYNCNKKFGDHLRLRFTHVNLVNNMRVVSTSASRLESIKDSSGGKKQNELNAKFVTNDPRMPAKQRLKNLIVLYGPTAVVLHIGLSLTFLGATYLVVRYGFDVPSFLENQNLMGEKYMMIIANGGTFGLAYALYKGMMPFRVLVTLFLTPRVARILQSYGIIKIRG